MTHPFLETLKIRPLLGDGAMGTLLYARGASDETSFEKLNLTHQDLVQQIHIDYINAGAEVIQTNSFAGNRFRLASHGLDKDLVWSCNVWAAKVARNAREIAGQPVFVAGSVGPTGKLLAPIGDIKKTELQDAFAEQMEGLLAGGVDLFVIESMGNIVEMATAVRAARKLSKLPVIAQMSFSTEGSTVFGSHPEDLARILDELADERPDVLGVNCGAGPEPVLESLKRLGAAVAAHGLTPDEMYLSALPNAGLPGRVGTRFMYVARPDYCASFVQKFVESGARFIGGCCGTTPDHIREMRKALDSYLSTHRQQPPREFPSDVRTTIEHISAEEAPAEDGTAASRRAIGGTASAPTDGSASTAPDRAASRSTGGITNPGATHTSRVSTPKASESSAPASAAAPIPEGGLATRLKTNDRGRFFISVELDPPRGAVARKLLQAAEMVRDAGADTINVGDSPMAKIRMSSLATCLLIQQKVGIETIIHFTTRDRNLMGIQADLLGCQALGIRNVIALTGDPPSVGNYAHATAVYDVDSVGLIKIISQLNQGVDIGGNTIGSPTSLSIACALNPTAENRALECQRLANKIAAGAHVIMTQPIYQKSDLTDFLDRFGDPKIPILVGIMPLNSFKHAEYLHNEVPGITIPEHIRKAMEKAGEEGARVGLELSEELIDELRPIIAGIYAVPSFGRYNDICGMVRRLKSTISAATVPRSV